MKEECAYQVLLVESVERHKIDRKQHDIVECRCSRVVPYSERLRYSKYDAFQIISRKDKEEIPFSSRMELQKFLKGRISISGHDSPTKLQP
jgi:hypothetical protein